MSNIESKPRDDHRPPVGDQQRGVEPAEVYGCSACHTVTDATRPKGTAMSALHCIIGNGHLAGEPPNT